MLTVEAVDATLSGAAAHSTAPSVTCGGDDAATNAAQTRGAHMAAATTTDPGPSGGLTHPLR